ncbi:MAG: peptide ABC transporter substrate-binding protein, partial [Spirochaetia bacterium]|nr:peptide ABC transporter substrate-binding protein [Spirochaetia bacterium]
MFSKKISVLIIFLLLPFWICASENTLNILFSDEKIEFNPFHTYTSTEAQLYSALYEGLVSYSPYTLEPVPAAAVSWTVSQNQTVYTFTLRKNGRFWDGTYVTAKIFRDTWLKMLSPEENSSFAFLLDPVKGARAFRNGHSDDPDSVGIRAIDDRTLQITLDKPADFFLKALCHHSLVPVHPDFLGRRDWSSMSSVPGNGPYYIISKTDQKIKLRKNRLYWDENNVAIHEINLYFVEDPTEASMMFDKGIIHWCAGNFDMQCADMKNVFLNPIFATSFFYFNCTDYPFDLPEIRNALVNLIPWDRFHDRDMTLCPASTLVLPVTDYPEIIGIERSDRENARAVLAGKTFEIKIKIPENPFYEQLAGILKSSWESVSGIAVRIVTVPENQYYDSLQDNDHSLGVLSWIGDYPDPLTFLQMWISDSSLNSAGFSDDGFDRAVSDSFNYS